MKNSLSLLQWLCIAFLSISLHAQHQEENFYAETPYFKVTTEGKSCLQSLPLKSIDAEVDISGVIANVKLTQTFVNTCDQIIEADYVFPGSSQSAVYDMVMKIGDREIKAKIKEKHIAKADYEKAKAEGKTASLLSQERPNVFQMNVGNILPEDIIKVEIYYTENIVPEDATYEFHLPVRVGERFATSKQYEKDKWVANPHVLNPGKSTVRPNHTFDLKLNINAGMPLKSIKSLHYPISINYLNKNEAKVNLKGDIPYTPKDDFVLRYQLSGDRINGGVLLYPGEEENFFMVTVQPPKHPKPESIPPRSYQFIIDVSGSMNGFPLDVSKSLMERLLKNLRKTDKFNILLFAGSDQMIFNEPISATSSNVKKALDILDDYNGSGGTQMLPAIKSAMKAIDTKGSSHTFVIVTDGFVTVEKEAYEYISDNLGKANFFAFGIGTNVNRYLIEGIANCGKGAPFIVYNEKEAKQKADKFIKYIQSPVFTDIMMITEEFDVYDIDTKNIPDLFAEKPIVVTGKYKGDPQGGFTFKGYSGNDELAISLPVTTANLSDKNEALKFLWARNRIRELSDYNRVGTNDKLIQKITQLGLKYNLLTEYTSFVAIDDQIRELAVKHKGAVPEPHEWMLIIFSCIMIAIVAFYYFK